jgi:hypothetical protein
MNMSIKEISDAKIRAAAAPAGALTHKAITTAPSRAVVFCTERWRQFRSAFAGHYRPEQHYMRGPGPKWRATHRPNAVTR